MSVKLDDSVGAGAHSARRSIMIVAGEASGDLHGADLARELRARLPDYDLYGIAGERMVAAGVRPLFRSEQIAALGLTELAATIGRTLRAWRALRLRLRSQPPNLLILIDFAEFNLHLARSARRAGVPVLYYIIPQVWAWRRGRVRKLIERADRLAVVFPFEAELFAAASQRVFFVGHPLLDRVRPQGSRQETLARHGLPPQSKLLALLPGSRPSEVRYLLPPMLAAARILQVSHGLQVCLALAPGLDLESMAGALRLDLSGIYIIRADTYSVVAASELALVASGTATLETALLECPMVIAYRVAPVTYAVARLLVTGVEHIGMPNILAGEQVVPELIQRQVSGRDLAAAAAPLLEASRRAATVARLRQLRPMLGAPGAARRVAALAAEMLT
ncbi:MAG TPA: lipid-A-disaccharide synthase [Candidatus Binataceae bacterium]|nr:lipid-A-disaccharide synthase [Candidatus Binataceae bacterium]